MEDKLEDRHRAWVRVEIAYWFCKLFIHSIKVRLLFRCDFIHSSKSRICWICLIKCVTNIMSSRTRCFKFAHTAIFEVFAIVIGSDVGNVIAFSLILNDFEEMYFVTECVLDRRCEAKFLFLTIHLSLTLGIDDGIKANVEWDIRSQVLSLSVKALAIVMHNYY